MSDSSSRSEGVQSFKDQEPSSACQYEKGSNRQREWLDGWVSEQGASRPLPAEDLLPILADAPSTAIERPV